MSLQTIENTREKDVTMIAPDDTEVDADDAQDEFAGEVLHILPVFSSHDSLPWQLHGPAAMVNLELH